MFRDINHNGKLGSWWGKNSNSWEKNLHQTHTFRTMETEGCRANQQQTKTLDVRHAAQGKDSLWTDASVITNSLRVQLS